MGRASFRAAQGFIEGARRDGAVIGSDWTPRRRLIDGVRVREVKNVGKTRGLLTEIFRREWFRGDGGVVDQVFQVWLRPDEISAWHTHQHTLDRLFVMRGHVRVVLFDARTGSATHGQVDELTFGTARPAIVTIPTGVWHGVHNVGADDAGVLNLVDHAYDYESPDHWRLPPDTDRIPYRFDAGRRTRRPRRRT